MRPVFALALAVAAPIAFADGLSFDQAVQTGVARSSRLDESRAAVKEAAGLKNRAQTALRPWLGLTGTATALDRTLAENLGQVRIVGANQWQSRLSLEANVAIDISGDLKGQVRLADLGVQAATLRYLLSRAEVVRDVKNAYLYAIQSDQLLESARATLRNVQDRRDIIQQLQAKGVLTRFDMLRTDTDVADANQKVTSAESRKRIAYANLARLIETPVTELAGLPDKAAMEVDPRRPLVDEALARRAEIGLARLQIRAEELGVHLAGASSRPSLTAGVQAYTLSNPGTFEPASALTAFSLTLRFPIVDRGESLARRKEAEGRLDAARAALSATEQDIRFQSVEAESRLLDAGDRMAVAEKALSLAEAAYQIALVRLQAGLTEGSLSPILEVSDTETGLTQARNNLINARIDRLLALVHVEFVGFGYGDSK